MNWQKYLMEKDAFKRYAMLERDNRLSYDHVDNWLLSLKNFLSKPSLNNDLKKVCPKCKKQTLSQISKGEAWGCENQSCSYIGKPIIKS